MTKRRKLKWIAGGLATVFALFMLTVFLIDYNSTDAKIERAIAQLVEEYGFEFQGQYPRNFGMPQRLVIVTDVYRRPPVEARATEEIVATLSSACPSWKLKSLVFDRDVPIFSMNGGPTTDDYRLTPGERNTGLLTEVHFKPGDKGIGSRYSESEAVLALSKYDRPSLWERIKGMLPW